MAKRKDFSCIGGLDKHIQILKEMVLFPLMYGDVYSNFNLKPPRGLLFYGPPGTGKTLVAGALATECSNSERKVSFISRKGSDCLSKWIGESEKKLQQIFQAAYQSKPCIIFFDEIDALAPVRTNHQDYVHASVVSTLLALMDGLENNSEVIVIGSTNRLDAIDPALRRAGRFDRELYFPLPCYNARKEILSIQMQSWKQKPSINFLAHLAAKTVGYCGSDLQAFCAEAVMSCVRRTYPQLYSSTTQYQIDVKSLRLQKEDFFNAHQSITPASRRVATTPVKKLPKILQPLLQRSLKNAMRRLTNRCPPGMLTSDTIIGKTVARASNCPRLLLCENDDGHTRYLGPAILHALEHLPCYVLDITTLFEVSGRGVEEAIIQLVKEARHTLPSLLYVPDVTNWWNLVQEPARVVFGSLLRGLDSSVSMLILTTADCTKDNLPDEIKLLFNDHPDETYELQSPGTLDAQRFFEQLYRPISSTSVNISPCPSNSIVGSSGNELIATDKRYSNTVQSGPSKSVKKIESVIEISYRRNLRPIRKCRRMNIAPPKRPIVHVSSKRDHVVSFEGPPSKRQKSAASDTIVGRNIVGLKKLTDEQIKELVKKSTSITRGWSTRRFEILSAILQAHIEKNDANLFETLDECLNSFRTTQKSKTNLTTRT